MIKFNGNDVTLVGEMVKVGDKAPDFTVIDTDMKEIKLSNYQGKKVIITIYPSIDTSVCQLQTKQFNMRAASLGDDVEILTISLDLPFALGRFCAVEGIDKIKTTSDHRDREFALKYGVLVDELKLLARGTIVINEKGIVEYVDILDEMTNEPNYDEVMAVFETK